MVLKTELHINTTKKNMIQLYSDIQEMFAQVDIAITLILGGL